MNERDKLIQKLIEEKGGTKKQYLQLLDEIAFHESAHTMDPTIKQIGGGPGRGKYQFEEGSNQGGITAARRTKQYFEELGMEIPKWLQRASNNDSLDASKLSSQQQDILFLGNMRKHPRADFSKVWSGEESTSDFWANYHWAGADKDRASRLSAFETSMEELKKNQGQPEIARQYQKEYRPEIARDNIPIPPNYEQLIDYIKIQDQINQLNVEQPELPSVYEGIGNAVSTLGMNNSFKSGGELNVYKEGGLHETNPNGGIPQGMAPNGKMNTVEEGETSFDLPSGKYIFSNRISTNGKTHIKSSTNKFQNGGAIDPSTKNISTSRQFIKNWFNDDVTRERLSENLRSYSKAQSLINSGLRNVSQTGVKQFGPLEEIEAAYKDQNIDIYGNVAPETIGHEFIHAMGSLDKQLSDYIINRYGTPLGSLRQNIGIDETTPLSQGVSKQFSIDPSTTFGRNQINQEIKHGQYLGRNGELYPRFMEMRQFLNVQPGDTIDNTHIEKLQNDSRMKKMFNYYSPNQIKDILNTVAYNNDIDNTRINVAANGGYIDPIKKPTIKTDNTSVKDNLYKYIRDRQDFENLKLDLKDLSETGQIENPKSAHFDYDRIENYKNKPFTSNIHQNKLSPKKREEIESKMNQELLGERGLVYLDNPLKLFGDIANAAGIKNNLPNSDKDKFNINKGRHFDKKSSLEQAGNYLPGAVFNTALGTIGASTVGGTLNNIFNPIAGGVSNPKTKLRTLDDVKKYYREQIELFKTDEAKKRLQNMGIDYNKFMDNLGKIDFLSTNEGSYYQVGTFLGHMDIETLNLYKKVSKSKDIPEIGIDIADRSSNKSVQGSIDHELGHFMQDKINRNMFDPKSGVVPTEIDEMLKGLILKDNLKGEALQNYSYFGNIFDKNPSTERLPFLREYRVEMIRKGILKNKYNEVTEEMIDKLYKKSPNNRINTFIKNIPENRKLLKTLLNSSAVLGAGITLNTQS